MAFAREPLMSKGSIQADAQVVSDVYVREGCDVALVGLPLLESGDEGEQARLTREFAAALGRRGVKVEFWDERYTSGAAMRKLEHVKPERKKALIDSEAARIMVEEYLAAANA